MFSSIRQTLYQHKRKVLNLSDSLLNMPKLRHVERLCFFIGCPRSGSTLICALLNAHRHIVISCEYSLLKKIMKPGMNTMLKRQLLLCDVLRKTKSENQGAGLVNAGYRYKIPEGCQTAVDSPRVLGDKMMIETARLYRQLGPVAIALANRFDWPVRFIHVIRNPYDNITTWCKRGINRKDLGYRTPLFGRLNDARDPMGELLKRANDSLLSLIICHYFSVAEGVQMLKEYSPDAVLDVHYQALTASPQKELRRIVRWLGLDCSDRYLDCCAQLVGEASRSRTQQNALWSARDKALAAEQIQRFDFLKDYAWDG